MLHIGERRLFVGQVQGRQRKVQALIGQAPLQAQVPGGKAVNGEAVDRNTAIAVMGPVVLVGGHVVHVAGQAVVVPVIGQECLGLPVGDRHRQRIAEIQPARSLGCALNRNSVPGESLDLVIQRVCATESTGKRAPAHVKLSPELPVDAGSLHARPVDQRHFHPRNRPRAAVLRQRIGSSVGAIDVLSYAFPGAGIGIDIIDRVMRQASYHVLEIVVPVIDCHLNA